MEKWRGGRTTTVAAILVTASIPPTDTFLRKLEFKVIVLGNFVVLKNIINTRILEQRSC